MLLRAHLRPHWPPPLPLFSEAGAARRQQTRDHRRDGSSPCCSTAPCAATWRPVHVGAFGVADADRQFAGSLTHRCSCGVRASSAITSGGQASLSRLSRLPLLNTTAQHRYSCRPAVSQRLFCYAASRAHRCHFYWCLTPVAQPPAARSCWVALLGGYQLTSWPPPRPGLTCCQSYLHFSTPNASHDRPLPGSIPLQAYFAAEASGQPLRCLPPLQPSTHPCVPVLGSFTIVSRSTTAGGHRGHRHVGCTGGQAVGDGGP